jgi:ferredoxin
MPDSGMRTPRSIELAVGPECAGTGTCRRLLPAVFGADDQRRSVVLASPVAEDDDVWEALESCPVEAISARDAATGEQLFP